MFCILSNMKVCEEMFQKGWICHWNMPEWGLSNNSIVLIVILLIP